MEKLKPLTESRKIAPSRWALLRCALWRHKPMPLEYAAGVHATLGTFRAIVRCRRCGSVLMVLR